MNKTTTGISTFGLYPGDNLTFKALKKAIKKIKPLPKMKIEVCKKHYKLLNKIIKEDKPKGNMEGIYAVSGNLGRLYGIPVYIRPYLKKVRIYTKHD